MRKLIAYLRIQTSSLKNYAIDMIFNATSQRHAKVDD